MIIRFLTEIVTITEKEDRGKCRVILSKILGLLTQSSSKKKFDHFIQLNMFVNFLFKKLEKDHFFFFILIIENLSGFKEVTILVRLFNPTRSNLNYRRSCTR